LGKYTKNIFSEILKKGSRLMKNIKILWISLCAVLVICAVGAFLAVPRVAVGAKDHSMVGAWEGNIYSGDIIDPVLFILTSDGTIQGSEGYAPDETATFGNWVSIAPDLANYTIKGITMNPEGTVNMPFKVVGEFKYDSKADSISGPFTISGLNPDGSTYEATGAITCTRIKVETLP
jgi:hypothetical protein